MRFGMPEGSRVGGFPVMEPAEQSMTGRPRGGVGGAGGVGASGTEMWNEEAKAEVMDIK